MRFIKALLILLSCSLARAENLYVTAAGAGATDGSDWSNAFAGLSDVAWGASAGQVGFGDTLWIAGGTYGVVTLGADGVTLKRARTTNSECTSATGWSAAYDATVTISQATEAIGITIVRNQITIDGQTWGGLVVNTGAGTTVSGDCHAIRTIGASNTFRNLKLSGPYEASNRRGMTAGSSAAYKTNITLSYVEIDGFTTSVFIGYIHFPTFEYCKFHNTVGNGTYHDNITYVENCDNGVWRYNEQYTYTGEGLYFASWDYAMDGWKIYGNLFRDTTDTGRAIEFDPNGSSPQHYGTNWYIYNNTFANIAYVTIRNQTERSGMNGYTCNGGRVFNNIFYNCSANALTNMTHDFNWYSGATDDNEANGIPAASTNPFLNAAYWIVDGISSVLPRDKGTPLGGEYVIDANGVRRDLDDLWDLGAYDYVLTVQGSTNIIRTGGRRVL